MNMIARRKFLGGLGLTLGAAGVSMPAIIRSAVAQAGMSPIKGVYSAPGLSFAGIDIAEGMGLWAKHGLTAEQNLDYGFYVRDPEGIPVQIVGT